MVGRGLSHLSHPDLHITSDEADVQSIVKVLDDDWTNPFDPNESEFVSISTDTLSPPYVARDILESKAACAELKRDRLDDERTKAHTVHDKITKKRLNEDVSDIRKKTSASN